MEIPDSHETIEDLRSKIQVLENRIASQMHRHKIDAVRHKRKQKDAITERDYEHAVQLAYRHRELELNMSKLEQEHKVSIAKQNLKYRRLKKRHMRLLAVSKAFKDPATIEQVIAAEKTLENGPVSNSSSDNFPGASGARKFPVSKAITKIKRTAVLEDSVEETTPNQVEDEEVDVVHQLLFGSAETEVKKQTQAKKGAATPVPFKKSAPAIRLVRVSNEGPVRQFGRARRPDQLDPPLIRGKIAHYEDLEKMRARKEFEEYGLIEKKDG